MAVVWKYKISFLILGFMIYCFYFLFLYVTAEIKFY